MTTTRGSSPDAYEGRQSLAALALRWIGPITLTGASAYLYAVSFANASTPMLLGGDQVFFWMDGQRLLYGERVYRDFFQFTPPGTDLVYYGLFELFGPRIWVTNLVVVLLGTILCWICYRISSLLMDRPRAALAVVLFAAIPYGRLLQATHHWFSVLAVLSAVAVLMKERTPVRIALAGALLGTATFFTQTRGPVAALAIAAYLTWIQFRGRWRWSSFLKSQLLLFVPFVLTWAALSSYYLATVGLQQLWFFQFTYVWRYMVIGWGGEPYLAPLFSRIGSVDELLGGFLLLLLPVVYLVCLWKCRKESPETQSANKDRVGLLAAVGAALFIEVAQSPSWLRLYCVAAPGVILSIWLAGQGSKWRSYVMRLLWVGAIASALHQTELRHRRLSVIAELPAGTVAIPPSASEKLSWLAAHTKPGQFFFQAGWPGVYLPLGLRNPVFLEDFETSGETGLGYVESSIRQLESKRVQYVLWSPGLLKPPYTLTFREFLERHYRRVRTFPDLDEVWERRR